MKTIDFNKQGAGRPDPNVKLLEELQGTDPTIIKELLKSNEIAGNLKEIIEELFANNGEMMNRLSQELKAQKAKTIEEVEREQKANTLNTSKIRQKENINNEDPKRINSLKGYFLNKKSDLQNTANKFKDKLSNLFCNISNAQKSEKANTPPASPQRKQSISL